MPNERENFLPPLTFSDFDIAGNSFRAYYDTDKKLVFVLDGVISDVKPNVLLVINPVGDRKWDDILQNDYAVDLETVRPKKDNRYQKMDIEYMGLAQYDNLIRAWTGGGDLTVALAEFARFRHDAARRAALERLGLADASAEKSRETIEKTTETINQLQDRLKGLRAKLLRLRQGVGKGPTKESAAKILKTESQIDAVNEKLARAKKRLGNAKQRLNSAAVDAENARNILMVLDAENVPGEPVTTDLTVVQPVGVPMEVENENIDIIPFQSPYQETIKTIDETKAENMADEEVKPLFDKDPEILDEEIAFKPIEFGVTETVAPVPETTEPVSETVAPLSFVPPVQIAPVADVSADMPTVAEDVQPNVLDALMPVELPSQRLENNNLDSELLAGGVDVPVIEEEIVAPVAPMPITPVMPSQTLDQSSPMPEISPAPINTDVRPVSPITGSAVDAATPVQKKTNVLYYVLLLILIALSIFTLWLYQKSANDTVPEIAAKTEPVVEVAETVEGVQEEKPVVAEPVSSPFIEPEETPAEPVVTEPVAPTVVPDVVPENVPVTEPTPVDLNGQNVVPETVPVIEPTPVTMEPSVVPVTESEPTGPFLTDEVVQAPKIPTAEEVLASKPAYNVSQNEKMFVAAPEYETDVVAQPEEEINQTPEVEAPVVSMGEPDVIALPEQEIYSEDFITEEVIDTCSDGNAPDADGCCGGEVLTDMGNGEYMCCAQGTDECFPPMF